MARDPDPEPDFEDLRDHLAAKPREEALHGFFDYPSVVVTWGKEGQGKTLFFLSAASAMLWGADWNGKPARRGLVFYFTWEGDQSLTGVRRLALYRYYRRTEPDVDEFKAVHFNSTEDRRLRRINLFSETGRNQLATMIRETSEAMGLPVVLICFDTGGSMIAAHHRKETGETFTSLALFLRALADQFKCAAMVVMHSRMKGDDIRGPVSFLTGEADTVMKCEAAGDRNERVFIEIRKQRAARGGQVYQFDVVEVDIAPGVTQPVLVFRGLAGAMGSEPLVSPKARADAMRDSEALLRLARAVEDDERLSVSALAKRAFGDDGGNQLKRVRRLIPVGGITIHVPEHHHMVRLALVVEHGEEIVVCEIKPEKLGDPSPPPYGTAGLAPDAPVDDTLPPDNQDGDDDPVPAGHMGPRETRWFTWFHRAFIASDADTSRYAHHIHSVRFPSFTADREAGIGLLHLMVANAVDDTVRERARLALERFGIVVPPPQGPGAVPDHDSMMPTEAEIEAAAEPIKAAVKEEQETHPTSGSERPSESTSVAGVEQAVRRRGGWPKGKKRGPRQPRPVAP